MRVGIYGASGRVGTRLVEAILANPGLELAAALVSPASRLIGTPVAGGSVEYRPAEAAMKSHCDVMIDFSNPAASLALQDMIGRKSIPIVVGTTGYSGDQAAKLESWTAHRPILISANFAFGFEAFEQSVLHFARQMPGAEPMVVETYHQFKKAEPSGTSQRLATRLRKVRFEAAGFDAGDIPVVVHREGGIVGINEVRFNLDSGETCFSYVVHTLAAYAEGAIAAARWLVERAPGPGRYDLADSLRK